MSIDYGAKSIGVAISDEMQLTARPLTTIRRGKQKDYIGEIVSLISDYEVGILVVGMPLSMDGTKRDAAGRVESFIAEMQNRISVPVVPVDERLTSHEADLMMREMGLGERERRVKSDEYAATIILRDYLEHLTYNRKPGSPQPDRH